MSGSLGAPDPLARRSEFLASSFRSSAPVLAVLCAGALWLAFTARRGFLELSWSDEIVYAVMGRNVAEGRGLITNFYSMDALLGDGHPQSDVHMPGHALAMSLFFLVFGSADWVAFAPSWAALLGSAVAVYALARRLFGTSAGLLAAALLLVMPGLAGYAHSAMAELTLTLASTLFLLSWWACTTPARAAVMAIALGAAVLCRESCLVFLLPACEALWRAPREKRRRLVASFMLALSACLATFAPLHFHRARFPHVLSDLPAFGSDAWSAALLARVRDNLRLPLPGDTIDEQQFAALLALGALVPVVVLLLRAEASTSRLAASLLVLTVANFAGLASLYPLTGWHGVRAFMFLAPWMATVLAGWPARVRHGPLRWLVAGAVVCLLGTQSLRATSALADDRRVEQIHNAEVAGLFQRLTEGLPIESVVAFEHPWEIGWRNFPVTVVWGVPDEPEHLRRINDVLRIDAVIGRTHRMLPLAQASERGELGVRYELLPRRPDAKRQVLVRSGLGGGLP